MKRLLLISCVFFLTSIIVVKTISALCGDTWQWYAPDVITYGNCPVISGTGQYSITKRWRIFWTDGNERVDAHAIGYGACYQGPENPEYCEPGFFNRSL
jgi:hypothetical protein